MKIKRFNDFNQINEELDKNDGANILPQSVKNDIKDLLSNIKDDVIDDPINPLFYPKFENELDNRLSYVVNIVLEKDFTNIIREYIRYFVLDSIKIVEEIDEQTTMLKFMSDEGDFVIPIITTMSADNMIYDGDNKISYRVWINTYVAKKIKNNENNENKKI
jgi:hypothetical protein